MEKPVRVTVLVYVHNAEKYLIDCLKSLSNQILDDMEIICINDGSTDESADILKNFATKEPRMRVIELKKSAGYGRVLNRGIKLASREYIGIIEATDFINPEMFIELFALAKKFDADV
ncbi:glycosyltransferase, partial [Candidatus Saccharibacteria bacterium]|nr:glycosyltransferase [Candidatus Saccharibacteria bacterium]